MHDHCDAAGATAMGPEDGEERSVAVVGILGIVEEPGLVHLRPQMLDLVGSGQRASDRGVNRNRLFLDVLALNQGFVSPLSQSPR